MPRNDMPSKLQLSTEGERYIKRAEEEGGMPKLKAYDDGTGTWTISWGCTKGVKKGMKITVEQAQAMFDAEIAECIADVRRVIKVPMSQGLFDAFVSFVYNNGVGKCQTLINAINSGNEAKIRSAWMLYVYAYNAKKKRKEVWPGLVNRRTSELAHWAKVDAKASAIDESAWAPAVEPDKPSWTTTASKSKSVWMQLQAICLLIMTWLTDLGQSIGAWIVTLFDTAPDIANSAGERISAAQQVAEWFGANSKGLVVFVLVTTAAIVIIRHVNDKRAAQ